MRLRFTQAAETDLASALFFYESQASGLAQRFLSETIEVGNRLLLFPHTGRVAFGDLRKTNLAHFPFGVVYGACEDEIVIYGVIDLRRHPDQIAGDLQGRLDEE